MKKIVAMLVAMVLLMSVAAAPASAMMTTEEKSRQYQNAIRELEAYLETPNSNGEGLYGIKTAFESLGRFEQSENLSYYVLVLIKLYEETYDYDLQFTLEMLGLDLRFLNYLENDLKGSPLCSVAELKSYVEAREKEHQGDYEGAIESYKSCMSYFDVKKRYQALREGRDRQTYDRALALQNAGDIAGAYFLFSGLVPYKDSENRKRAIENVLGYTPASPSDNLQPVTGLTVKTAKETEISLSWKASAHAKTYEVQYRENNSGSWINAEETNSTGITVNGLKANTTYTFRVTAAIGKIKAEAAEINAKTSAQVTPTPKPTAAQKNTATPISSTAKRSRIAAGGYHTVALKADGTVLADGNNYYGQCNVSDWKDIVSVAAGGFHTVGLRSDGTVVAVGYDDFGQCSGVADWKNIVQIAATDDYTYGLQSDGTVRCTGYGPNVLWDGIVSIAAGWSHVLGLRIDGTVVATTNWTPAAEVEVNDWTDVTELYAGYEISCARTSTGSYWQAIGDNDEVCKKIRTWEQKNVQAVACGWYYEAIGLTDSGKIVTTGLNTNASLESMLEKWDNIIEIAAGCGHYVGLQADGTVVVAINHSFRGTVDDVTFEYGRSKISNWNLFK